MKPNFGVLDSLFLPGGMIAISCVQFTIGLLFLEAEPWAKYVRNPLPGVVFLCESQGRPVATEERSPRLLRAKVVNTHIIPRSSRLRDLLYDTFFIEVTCIQKTAHPTNVCLASLVKRIHKVK